MPDSDEFQFFQTALAAYDAPAFIRRARDVEFAWETLLTNCSRKRDVLLTLPRMWLATLFATTQSWSQTSTLSCSIDDLTYLQELHRLWSPQLRTPVNHPFSERKTKQVLAALSHSFQRFNHKWLEHVARTDLTRINKLRDGYNRYYLLEKECAVWSSEVAQQGFVELPPARMEDLLERFPLLKVPSIPAG